MNVKFLKGLAAQYAAATKDAYTFYYTTDDNKVYLGEIELSTPAGVAAAIALVNDGTKGNEALYTALTTLSGNIGDNEDLDTTAKDTIVNAINELKSAIDAINDASTGILKQAKDYTDGEITTLNNGIRTDLGNKENLTTDAKTNLVAAINEVDSHVDSLVTDAAITIEEESSQDYAKVYKVYQGDKTVATNLKGTINIPKDMVVSSGRVVVNPQGQPEGTYIELTLANAAQDKIYINVANLVDIYTAEQDATEVQLAFDGYEISATLVNGGVSTAKLADNAVTTAKIADENVTKAKLAQSVQDSLDAADSALQASDIAEGATNGTIAVDGKDISVHGLGSAAYTESTAYATAAQGAKADTAIQGISKGDNNGEIKYTVDGTNYTAVSVHGLGSAAYTNSSAYDAAGMAATAENNAKAYTDAALTWQDIAPAQGE